MTSKHTTKTSGLSTKGSQWTRTYTREPTRRNSSDPWSEMTREQETQYNSKAWKESREEEWLSAYDSHHEYGKHGMVHQDPFHLLPPPPPPPPPPPHDIADGNIFINGPSLSHDPRIAGEPLYDDEGHILVTCENRYDEQTRTGILLSVGLDAQVRPFQDSEDQNHATNPKRFWSRT